MAFVKRKKQITDNINDDNVNVSSTEQTKPNDDTSQIQKYKGKSYLDMTLEVIDILEKQGVDLYDENRFGGMYQSETNRNKYQQIRIQKSVSKLKNSINSINTVSTNNTDVETKNNTDSKNSLLNFYKNKNS